MKDKEIFKSYPNAYIIGYLMGALRSLIISGELTEDKALKVQEQLDKAEEMFENREVKQ